MTHLRFRPRFVLENVTAAARSWPLVARKDWLTAKQRPTRRQLEVLRTYIGASPVAAAAYELGISETTLRQHLSGLYRRTGCMSAAHAAYWLGRGRSTGAGSRFSP